MRKPSIDVALLGCWPYNYHMYARLPRGASSDGSWNHHLKWRLTAPPPPPAGSLFHPCSPKLRNMDHHLAQIVCYCCGMGTISIDATRHHGSTLLLQDAMPHLPHLGFSDVGLLLSPFVPPIFSPLFLSRLHTYAAF